MPVTRANTGLESTMFTITVLPHQPALLGRARQLAGNDADAQDLVQETLERALRTFQHFRPGSAVTAWLMTIMRSVWIDAWRRRNRGLSVVSSGDLDPPAPEPEPIPLYEMADAIVELIPEAMGQLPPKLRAVLELRLVSKWSYQAIASHLKLRPQTVGTRLLRARRQLAEILEREMPRLERDAGYYRRATVARAEPEDNRERRGD